ncbi:MAG: MFS transporter [Defluviitaleaceae bacterium]|nr:MFS transporter [Defluviitaleaceae bacterium]
MQKIQNNSSKTLLLVIILLSYFVVGFPDGAFTVSWLGIYYDLTLTIAHSGYILVGYSVTYTLAGVMLARLNRFMYLQTIYLCGLVIMGVGFVMLALSPNFIMVLISIVVYGLGTGAMASSMNSYMAKHFTARHNNWMHCFWGGGAALTPLIMAQMMAVATWRTGYFVITAMLGVVAVMLLISMYKKVWINETPEETEKSAEKSEETENQAPENYLTKKWHQAVEVLTFFFLGGTDYTLVFFTGIVLVESRGLSPYAVGIFSTVYYLFMTLGRMFFGWLAKRIKEVPIIRMGCVIALGGIAVLYFTSNVVGMALTGFGLAPLLPTLVSDTSNRFQSKIISKLVGYELAAFGAGIAVLFFMTSLILEFITLEALFPIGVSFIILVFLCNEVLHKVVKSVNKY